MSQSKRKFGILDALLALTNCKNIRETDTICCRGNLHELWYVGTEFTDARKVLQLGFKLIEYEED